MKKLVLVFAFVIGVSAVSFAQGGGRRTPKEQTDRLKEQIAGITDDQATKITTVYTEAGKKRDSLMKASNGDRQAMRGAYMKMMPATDAKIKAILTADQAKEYQKMVDARAERMKQMQNGN